jgi:hypothetical protein
MGFTVYENKNERFGVIHVEMLEVTANKQYSQSLMLDAQDIKRQHRAMSSKSVIQNFKNLSFYLCKKCMKSKTVKCSSAVLQIIFWGPKSQY